MSRRTVHAAGGGGGGTLALPMDEQRILEEMERMLAADDPRLAARLAAFGQPGIGHVLRTRRARATMSVMTLALIAAVAAVIYMMSALKPNGFGGHNPHSGQPTAQPSTSTKPAVSSVSSSAIPAGQRQAGRIGMCAPASATACGRFVPIGRPHVQPPHQGHH